eukprot:scaffold20940_cov17-Tisochrysis_lutea.AAC.1
MLTAKVACKSSSTSGLRAPPGCRVLTRSHKTIELSSYTAPRAGAAALIRAPEARKASVGCSELSNRLCDDTLDATVAAQI